MIILSIDTFTSTSLTVDENNYRFVWWDRGSPSALLAAVLHLRTSQEHIITTKALLPVYNLHFSISLIRVAI